MAAYSTQYHFVSPPDKSKQVKMELEVEEQEINNVTESTSPTLGDATEEHKTHIDRRDYSQPQWSISPKMKKRNQ